MALAINEATYGRDAAGRKKLLADFQAEIDKAIKVMETEQTTVIDTVKKYWIGKDADAFIKNFKQNVADMKADFNRRKKDLESVLSSDSKEFEKFQDKVANNLGNSGGVTVGSVSGK